MALKSLNLFISVPEEFSIVAKTDPRINKNEQLKEIEMNIGKQLPSDYKDFLKKYGGCYDRSLNHKNLLTIVYHRPCPSKDLSLKVYSKRHTQFHLLFLYFLDNSRHISSKTFRERSLDGQGR